VVASAMASARGSRPDLEDVASGGRWRPLVAPGLPGPDEVRVVHFRLDTPAEQEDAEILSEAERARAARLVFPLHRHRFAAAHAGLRRVLGTCFDRPPGGLVFAYSDRGRPRLQPEPDAGFDFNLAHSGDVGLVALARRTVGVDVEILRDVPGAAAIARRFFTPREVAALAPLEGEAYGRGFFQAWTRKEALVKAVGTGLSALAETEVTLAPGEAAALLSAPEGTDAWDLFHLEPSPECVGAVAVRRAGAAVRLTTWSWRRRS
jgi:4'-phosphopantetheinyl transferase